MPNAFIGGNDTAIERTAFASSVELVAAGGLVCRGQAHQRVREASMAGKFEVYKDGQGKYRFRLKAGYGEIIAVGEAYESKDGALGGIDSVRRNAAHAELVDQTGS
jgi:uncharacterized protein YegP (UPF0339 family)